MNSAGEADDKDVVSSSILGFPLPESPGHVIQSGPAIKGLERIPEGSLCILSLPCLIWDFWCRLSYL